MTPREPTISDSVYDFVKISILPVVLRRVRNPNRITVWGMAIALTAPLAFWMHPAMGVLIIVVSGLCDMLDGMAAKAMDRRSIYGTFLDSTADRVADFSYLFGFWALCAVHGGGVIPGVGICLALAFTFMGSYVKARAGGLRLDCPVGIMNRGTRVGYLICWGIFLWMSPNDGFFGVFWSGLIVYLILAIATLIQRIRYVYGEILELDDWRMP